MEIFSHVCACMGPLLGQPHCPCKMQRLGLSDGSEYKWSAGDISRLNEALKKLSTKHKPPKQDEVKS